MAEDTILSKDELSFIRKLMQRNGGNAPERAAGFRVDGGAHSNELLMQLAARANLSLHAEFEEFRMSFPIQLREDELHSLDLQLAPPVIYERGPTTRAWRLHLDEPLPLLENDGGESSLSVHELSPHGLLVDAGKHHKPPKHFHLRLALPDDTPLEIDAHRVRELKGGLAAYEVEYTQEKDAERIRSFLYRQHQRLHPDLQPELPADLV
ncbi:PilZ domain-containing protein [Pseudomonas stutzeri]|uniref:PilZ domain-containing protein n=1 Tax=Stutzerimonas stutzeri TaxID=316 RepID=A0A2N8S1Y9_STUST|nr:PilZ domain-containing protein [Stutzerimonas stutzeri]MCQ4295801.1 PilZ domain-containing protein [Stutzerimonas stutzeri]PNF80638.1 PilZ domain-containing protein [Stutzerimonas stutzeri]